MNGKMRLWYSSALYSTYKKLGQFLFYTYLLTCLNKDTLVLLKVINIWTNVPLRIIIYAQKPFNKIIKS